VEIDVDGAEPESKRNEAGSADRDASRGRSSRSAAGRWRLNQDPHAVAARRRSSRSCSGLRLVEGEDDIGGWSAADGGAHVGGITSVAAAEPWLTARWRLGFRVA
jgi:hypothetical protein